MKISKSRTEEKRRVERATIFLRYMEGVPVSQIAKEIGLSRQSIYESVDKALAFGPIAALTKRLIGPGRPGRNYRRGQRVLSIACQSPSVKI